MGLRYPDQTNCACFFVTTTFKNHAPLGDVEGVYEALAESLLFYASKYEAKIAGYVFMPSHIHFLMFVEGNLLPDFMRDFKKYIAQKAAKELDIRMDSLWMPRYDRVVVATENVFRTKLQYIHENPVKGQLVETAAEWKWSSAGEYLLDLRRFVPVWKEWA